MRAIIKLFILCGLAALAILYFKDSNDVVILLTGDEKRTIPILVALMLSLILFTVFYIAIRLLVRLLDLPKSWSKWSEKRHENKDINLLETGWLEFLEGNGAKAEKDLLRLVDHTTDDRRQVLARMAAARAAHSLQHYEKRDQLLAGARQLSRQSPRLEAAVATVQAELLLEQGQGSLALEHLNFVSSINTKQTHIQELLMRAYRQAGDTLKFIDMARQLHHKKVLSHQDIMVLLDHYGATYILNASYEDATALYQQFSVQEKAIPAIALAIATRYQQLGEHKKAGAALELALNQTLDSRLLAQYVQCPQSELSTRIQQAQKWLATDENNVDLLNALGQLCLMSTLWGQAERYLSKSLSIRENVRVHALLGLLNDRQGRMQEAIRHWRLSSGVSGDFNAQNILAAADTSNDPAPPDIKSLAHSNEHLLRQKLETSIAVKPTDDEEYFDSAPVIRTEPK